MQEGRNVAGDRSPVSHLLARLSLEQRRAPDSRLSPEALRQVAHDLGLSLAFVHGVATFYSMLSERPRGRHILRVCESPPCRLAGGGALVDQLGGLLGISPGETTTDGEFTLELSSCLGACDHAPAFLLDEALHVDARAEELPRLLEAARRSGWVGPRQGPATILGRPLHLLRGLEGRPEDGAAMEAYEGLKRAVTRMTPDEVLGAVKEAKLRGRGGAGFPAARKWEFARRAVGEPKYLICNADEGEPGTFKDRVLLEGTADRVLEGMAIAAYAIGASRGYLYIRGEYAQSIRRVEEAIREARQAGYLGERVLGTSFSFDVEVRVGAGAYVCGDETALIDSIEGKRGFPRVRPPYPATAGLWAKPTVVHNVETLANLPDILRDGVSAYRRLGTESSPGTKLYPLSGSINRPGLVEAEMGTSLRTLIFEFGGGMREGSEFKTALVGGAAGAFLGPDMLDVPLEYDALAAQGAVLGSGAVLVLDQGCGGASLLRDILRFFANESCGQCVPCRLGTARLLELMEALVEGKGSDKDVDRMLEIARQMRATSLCPLGQSCYPLLESAMRFFRAEFLGGEKSEVGAR